MQQYLYFIWGKRQRHHLAMILPPKKKKKKKATESVDFNHFSGVILPYLGLEFQKALL